jgi:hypothetical protein
MMQTTVAFSLWRFRCSILVTLIFIAVFLLFPNSGHSQAPASALPTVTTTNGMIDAATATGHPKVITLSGASNQPLVHSSFAPAQPPAQPTAGKNQNVQTLTQLTTTQAEGIYHYDGSQPLEHSFVNNTPPPSFSSPSGEYTGQLRLMLGSGSPQTQIYYTLNGDEPNTRSALYTKPLTLTESTTIKAVAFSSGQPPSPVATAEYKILQPTLTIDFASNGVDSVEIFLNLNAPGAASLAGDWSITDGDLTLCRASLNTESMMHCTARLNRGNHDLKANYTGVVNGWKLDAASSLQIK